MKDDNNENENNAFIDLTAPRLLVQCFCEKKPESRVQQRRSYDSYE